MSNPTPEPWWTINGSDLLAMLRRVAAGESPDVVYAEEYANWVKEVESEDADSGPTSEDPG